MYHYKLLMILTVQNSCGIACLRIKLKEKSLIYFSKPV